MSYITCSQLGVRRDACYDFNKLITKYDRAADELPFTGRLVKRRLLRLQLKI